jgi:hypothetical protein
MKDLKELREESKGNTRMLWHHDYWDGPISGVILWDNEMCWFSQKGDDIYNKKEISEEEKVELINWAKENNHTLDEMDFYDFNHWRIYDVYRIPKETMDAIIFNHELFKKYVGEHTDYDENGVRPIGKLRPSELHSMFYERREEKKVNLDLEKCEIIGEFKY